jgi:23S rRNA (guanosine2251-2'-O)-methyltransferase
MPVTSCRIRQCQRPECRFRFPVLPHGPEGEHCPHCGAPTAVVEDVHAARPLDRRKVAAGGPVVEALLDNIRSIYNVGSMFRTADGAGVRHLYLCGMTPTPEHPKTAKTALGAEIAVPWTRHRNGVDAAVWLMEQGRRLWALEEGMNSRPLFDTVLGSGEPPVVLVVGNEIVGVDPGILRHCKRVLHIPMQGVKESLNVATAFGVAVYWLRTAGVVADG